MTVVLSGKRVAVLVTDGFEEAEFSTPVQTLKKSGAHVEIIALKPGMVKSWSDGNWSKSYPVDKVIAEVDAKDYDALVLPGGVMNPDRLRINKEAIGFVAGFFDDSKPIAAICHGPWTLIETGELKGRNVTSFPSLKTDLINAGAIWSDEAVVVDNGLVTSRYPNDLPIFCEKMLEEIGEGIHQH